MTPELLRASVAPSPPRRLANALLLPAIMLVAAANFLWQLGTSSLFVDEALSVQHSVPPISNLIHAVRLYETTPWTYFIGLHEWIGRTGSGSDSGVRLPSVIAGVALVAAAYWMARVFVERRAALAAAFLCAIAPIVLQYAQQARAYIFATLAATVAVGATVRGARPNVAPRQLALLLAGGASAILALWLHYTATLVVLPLCVWLALQRALPRVPRITFIASCVVAELLLLPLFIDQYNAAPNGGIGPTAGLKFSTAMDVLGTPLNGRFELALVLSIIAAATIGTSILVVVTYRRGAIRDPVLLASLAALTPIALILAGAVGKDVVITRYSAVATPFMLTAIVAAIICVPRPAAFAIASATLALVGAGLIKSHSRSGFYPPAREAVNYLRATAHSIGRTILPRDPAADIPLEYYASQRLHLGPGQLVSTKKAARVRQIFRERPNRLWVISEAAPRSYNDAQLLARASSQLARIGYRAASVRTFTTSSTFEVYLLVPTRSGSR
jgi:Dolichyl-phosphate-mannose-protein mannosyltransferase